MTNMRIRVCDQRTDAPKPIIHLIHLGRNVLSTKNASKNFVAMFRTGGTEYRTDPDEFVHGLTEPCHPTLAFVSQYADIDSMNAPKRTGIGLR
jgi:hypothetical protein